MSLFVILGMHRSGTSFLTRSLHEAGCYLGTDLMADCARDNLEGHWENRQAVHINERLLELSGGTWSAVPQQLRSDRETDERMARFVQSLQAHPIAGWKDPRTTITFPLWKPHLADCRIIAALRHPMSVARSLHVRNGMPLEDGLRLWADYNERLLQHTAAESGVLWFDFDAPPEQVTAAVRRICEELGLGFSQRIQAIFNPYLRHHKEAEPIADRAVEALYRELRSRAGADWSDRRGAGSSAAADIATLSAHLEQLAWVQALQNANQQKVQREYVDHFRDIGSELALLQTRLEQLRADVQNGLACLEHPLTDARQRLSRLEPEVEACSSFVERIRTSGPYRAMVAAARLLQKGRRMVRRPAPVLEQQSNQTAAGTQEHSSDRRAA